MNDHECCIHIYLAFCSRSLLSRSRMITDHPPFSLLLLLLSSSTLPPSATARTLFAASGTFGDDNGPFASSPSPSMVHLPPNPSFSRHSFEQNLPYIMAFMRELSSGSAERVHRQQFAMTTGKQTAQTNRTKATKVVPIVVKQSSDSGSGDSEEVHADSSGSESKSKEMSSNELMISIAPEYEEPSEERREEFIRKIHHVPIKDDHAQELYQHWADQAFANLFAVIANQKLKEFEKPVHDEFGECCKRAKTVPMHAKCVSDLMKGRFDGAKYYSEVKNKTARFDRYRMKKRGEFRREMINGTKNRSYDDEWVGSFRMMDSPTLSAEEQTSNRRSARLHVAHSYALHRRERRQTGIVKKNYYELLTPSEGRVSPLGQVAKMMMKQVLKAKGKQDKDVVPWQQTVQKIKNSAKRRKEIKKKLGEDPVESMDQLTYRGLRRQGAVDDDLNDLVDDPQKLRRFLDRKMKQKGKAPIDRFVKLLREGLKLGYAFAGKNMSNFDDKTLKTLSPRFLSVTPEQDPEQNDTIDFMSPSLFSLHSSGTGVENLTSIPNMFNNIGGAMGFSDKDQQLWMDFIMEAAGVVEDAEKIEAELNETAPGEDPLKKVWEKHYDKERYEREIRTKDGTPLYFTRQNISDGFGPREAKKVDIFETLQKMMGRDQVKDMNRTGFALMTKDQLDLLYGPKSEYHDEEAFKRFTSMDKSTMLQHIEQDIHTLAQIKSFKITRKDPPPGSAQQYHPKRSKRAVVLSPISFSPFILVSF